MGGALGSQPLRRLEAGASPLADADITTLSADGSVELIPYGPGLTEVADQHFLFLSAISGAAEEAEDAEDVGPEGGGFLWETG